MAISRSSTAKPTTAAARSCSRPACDEAAPWLTVDRPPGHRVRGAIACTWPRLNHHRTKFGARRLEKKLQSLTTSFTDRLAIDHNADWHGRREDTAAVD